MGFKQSTSSETPINKSPRMADNHENICISNNAAQHVYAALEANTTVNPFWNHAEHSAHDTHKSVLGASGDSLTEQDANPYQAALHKNLDFRLTQDPMTKKSSSNWSLKTNLVTYTAFPQKSHITPYSTGKCLHNLNNKNPPDSHFKFNEIEQDEEYLDHFEEVQNTLKYSTSFDDNDVSSFYLGPTSGFSEQFQKTIHIEHSSLYLTYASIFNNEPCGVLVDSGATTSYMSLDYYKSHPALHTLPKLTGDTNRVKMGNGQHSAALFIIPLITNIQGHLFEIYTLVANLDDNLDLVLGAKNLFEFETISDNPTGQINIQNRSLPIFPQNDLIINPGHTAMLKLHMPFPHKIQCMALCKFWKDNRTLITQRIKIVNNQAIIQVKNDTSQPMKYQKDTSIGILDLRSIGYFKLPYKRLVMELQNTFNFTHYYKMIPHQNTEPCSEEFNSFFRIRPDNDHKPSKLTSTNTNTYDKYPWLDNEDPRRHMTDKQILLDRIDLSNSSLTKSEKIKLHTLIYKYKKAFSLRDEIGHCPNMKADIKIIDDSPFFVRPFRLSEEDKPFMDRQMERLVSLGILTKNSTSHTSPVMLITRKLTNDKRPVVDFRLLNTRILRRNTSIPLMSDVLNILGNSKCEVLSCLDLKDAYHSIPLTPESKEYCGILPYFGSSIYRYEVLPMGIACAPQIWMDYITLILDGMEHKQKYIAIMDDLLIHSLKKDHWLLLENLMKAMIKNGLKLSPKKCLLFQTQLKYMGNEFVITNKQITIRALKSRIEAIQQFPTPKSKTDAKSFSGLVNYLSMFCPQLRTHLKPITFLTRQAVPFIWQKEQEEAFIKIKKLLSSPPVLSLPKPEGRFVLYSDTSREHTGSSLWQLQDGHYKLIGFASKTLPPACKNYSVTELEMTGLLMNIALWKHLLKHREFDAAVDHAAVVQILKSKNEPASPRIMRLLERLSTYSFNLYYVKGKDMIIADYLSRHRICDEDPNELIPISFCFLYDFLEKCDIDLIKTETNTNTQLNAMTTRSKTKQTNAIKPPPVHGGNKPLNPNLKPEHQYKPRPQQRQIQKRQIQTPLIHTPTIPRQQTQIIPYNPVKSFSTEITPSLIGKYTNKLKTYNPQPIQGIDTGENEEVLDPEIVLPSIQDFITPHALDKQINMKNTIQKFLPKQQDLDKILKQIDRKVLRDTRLPCTLKDLRAAYIQSPHFRDIYIYLLQNRLPINKRQALRIQANANNYLIMDGLLFKINPNQQGDYDTLLCIPTSKVDSLLEYYHDSIFGNHTGIIKCYKTISNKFYCPNLVQILRAYITGCHVCQLHKTHQHFDRPLQKRININTPAMSKISMDIKEVPGSTKDSPKGHILVLLCEVTNFMVALPLKSCKTEHIIHVFIHGYLRYFGPPTHIICDLDPAFTSSLMQAFADQLNIKLITVSVTNHKSLLAEHGIKSLSSLLVKHLSETWSWQNILPFAMLCYNSYSTPNLDNYNPYQLVFGHQPNSNYDLAVRTDPVISGNFKTYYEKLKKNLDYMRQRLIKFRDQRIDLLNRSKTYHHYQVGQIVYMYIAKGTIVQTGSRKISCKYLGPLVVYKAIGPNQFLLMSLKGEIYPRLVEETRLKPGIIRTHNGNVTTLADLRLALSDPSPMTQQFKQLPY